MAAASCSVSVTYQSPGAAVRPLKMVGSTGDLKAAFVKITLSGTYTSGGVSCNLSGSTGIHEVLYASSPSLVSAGAINVVACSGLIAFYDITNKKVIVLNTATGTEVASGEDVTNFYGTMMVVGQ